MSASQQIYLIVVVGTFVITCFIFFVISFVIYYKKNQQTNALEKRNLEQQYENAILSTQLEIQEQTLESISQEIHDNIGQTLSFVKLNINSIDLSQQEQTAMKLSQSKELITKAIQDLRGLSKILNTTFIATAGLADSIKYQLDYLEKAGTHKVICNMPDDFVSLPPQTEMLVFRVVQELLNNIVKHAQASCIQVDMECTTSVLQVVIADDGKGFDIVAALNRTQSNGLGLSNMKKRLEPVKGNMVITSEPYKGTTAVLTIPINAS